MANVTGDSAEEVSSYMTAIWNNYARGSENLEHFTDVMADLGARTASSSSEIADGLQQFVALGPVIGLSFDNAAAALAAVSSSTRESANVIGNSFKTIFSRLEGLSLGKTLDDGVDLNKYSLALSNIGVQVLDTSGQLKDADTILEDIMDKWDDLSRTQQVATAQAVAGVYQYSRFMALMEAKDSYHQNLEWAQSADGAVDKQMEYYEDSWTAAQNRFKDSLNQVYNQLNLDEGAKTLYNSLDKIASGLAHILEQMGGVKTLFLAIAGIAGGMFSTQINAAFSRINQNFAVWINGSKMFKNLQTDMMSSINSAKEKITDQTILKDIEAQEHLIQVRQKALEQSKSLTEQERQYNEVIIQNLEAQNEAQAKLRESLVEQGDLRVDKTQTEIDRFLTGKRVPSFNDAIDTAIVNDISNLGNVNSLEDLLINLTDRYQNLIIENKRLEEASRLTSSSITEAFSATDNSVGMVQRQVSNAVKSLKDYFPTIYAELAKNNQGVLDSLENMAIADLDTLKQYADRVVQQLNQVKQKTRGQKNDLSSFFSDIGYGTKPMSDRSEKYWNSEKQMIEGQMRMSQAENALITQSAGRSPLESMLKLSSAAGQAAMAISSLRSIKSVFSDEATSSAEKMVSVLMSLSLLLPSLKTGITGVSGFFDKRKQGQQAAENVKNNFVSQDKVNELNSVVQSKRGKINQPKQALNKATSQAKQAQKEYDAALQKSEKATQKVLLKEREREKQQQKLNALVAKENELRAYQSKLVKDGAAYKRLEKEIGDNQKEQARTQRGIWTRDDNLEQFRAERDRLQAETDALQPEVDRTASAQAAAESDYEEARAQLANAEAARVNAEAHTQENSVTTANTAITRLNTEENLTAAEVEALKTEAIAAGIITQDKDNQSQRIGIALERQGFVATMAQATAEAAEMAAVEGKNVALAKTVAIVQVLEVQMERLAAAILSNPLFWGAAAIAAVVGSLYLLSKVLSADEDRLEASKSKLQELNDTLSETKTAYEDIQDSLSTYEEAKNSLDGLTKGTKEWNEALTAANEKILEILTNFPELWAYVTRDENGMFSISDGGFEEVIDQKHQEYIDTQKDTNTQQNQVRRDENAVTRKGLSGSKIYFGGENALSISTTDSDRGLYDRYMSGELDLDQIKDIIDKREKTDEARTEAYNAIVSAINKTEANNTSNKNSDVQTLGLGLDADFFSGENATNTQLGLETLYTKRAEELRKKFIKEMNAAQADITEEDINNYVNKHMFDISDEEIAQYINDFSEITNQLLSSNEETAGGVLGQLLTGDGTLTGYTDAELQEVQKQLKETLDTFNEKDFEGLTDEEIIQQLFGVDSETAKVIMEQLGVDTTSAFVEGVKSFLFGTGKKSVIEDTLDQNENLDDSLKDRIAKAYANLSEDDKKIALEIIPDLTEEDAEEFLDDTENYIKKYSDKLEAEKTLSNIVSEIDAAKDAGDTYNFDSSDVEAYAKQLQRLAKEGKIANKTLADNYDTALEVAFAYQKMNDGLEKIRSGWEDWQPVLAKGSQNNSEWSNVFNDYAAQMEKVLGMQLQGLQTTSGEPVDITFLADTESLKLAEQALNGDADAVDRLKAKAQEKIFFEVYADEIDDSGMKDDLIQMTNLITNWVKNNNLEVGANIDDSQFNKTLYAMAAAVGTTVQEIAGKFGFTVGAKTGEYDYIEVPTSMTSSYYNQGGVKQNSYNGVSPSVGGKANAPSIGYTRIKIPRFTYGVTNSAAGATNSIKNATGTSGSKDSGSSGSGSKYEPDTLDEEFDKYYYYKKSIDDLAKAYDRLSAARDRAYDPKDYAAKTAQMNANLDAQLEVYKKYQAELLNDLLFDKNYLASLGAQFDSWGNMTNYEAFMKNQQASFQLQLNNASSEEEAEKIKERWETLQGKVEQWQDEHDAYADATDKVTELTNEKIDNKLSSFQFELDVNTEEADVALDHISARLSHLDHYKLNVSLLVDAQEDELGEMLNKLEYQRHYLRQLNAEAATDGMTKDLQDAINEAKKNIDSLVTEIENKVDDIGEDIQKVFDDLDDRVDSTKNRLSSFGDILGNMKDIINLSGKKYTENATYNALQKTVEQVNKGNISVLKGQLKNLQDAKAEMEKARAELAAQGADEAVLKQWDDKIKEATEQITSLGADLTSAIQESISAIVDAATEALEDSMKKAEMKLFNIGDLDMMKNYYDEYQELSEEYLDNTEKTYELNKLMRQINNSIADKNNVTGAKELAALADEVTQKQAEGVKLSQYDVDLLNAKYQLTLAQIALEEAQNNKTTMRLRRDASGNYTYVYTADADAISNAEQEVEDKQKNLYDISKEHEEKIAASWFDVLQQYEERVQELQEKYQAGIITQTEFNEQKAALDEIYKQKIQYIYDELNKVYKNSTLTFEDSVLKKTTAMGSLTEIFDKSNQFIKDISADATQNARDQATAIENVLDEVGTSVGDLADDFETANTQIANSVNSMVISTKSDLESFNASLEASIAKIKEYSAAASAAFGKTSEAYVATEETTGHTGDLSKLYMNAIAAGDTKLANELLSERTGKMASMDASTKNSIISNDILEKWAEYYNDLDSPYHEAAVKMLEEVNKGGSAKTSWEKTIAKMNTGGYTGPWGSEGKLALLHEKELVLNKTDTENILDAVNIIRSMSQSITSSLVNDLVNLVGAAGKISSGIFSNDSDKVPQMVSIEASFPNVSVASEIEEAFNDLANQAAQFASIKRV